MSTVVLYCWCHSDSASVLMYFTFLSHLFSLPCVAGSTVPREGFDSSVIMPFSLMYCGCDTTYIVLVHIQCQASIYTLSLCRGHSWWVRLAKQETLTPPGHLVSPLVCRGPWMSTVVLYCWCHSDSASVLLYFTYKDLKEKEHLHGIISTWSMSRSAEKNQKCSSLLAYSNLNHMYFLFYQITVSVIKSLRPIGNS